MGEEKNRCRCVGRANAIASRNGPRRRARLLQLFESQLNASVAKSSMASQNPTARPGKRARRTSPAPPPDAPAPQSAEPNNSRTAAPGRQRQTPDATKEQVRRHRARDRKRGPRRRGRVAPPPAVRSVVRSRPS